MTVRKSHRQQAFMEIHIMVFEIWGDYSGLFWTQAPRRPTESHCHTDSLTTSEAKKSHLLILCNFPGGPNLQQIVRNLQNVPQNIKQNENVWTWYADLIMR